MGDNDYKIFWSEAIRQLLRDESLTQHEYDMWFVNMTFVNSRENALIFSVPSNFYRDQVKYRYISLIEKTLFKLSGTKLSVEFIINKSFLNSSSPNITIPDKSSSPATTPPVRALHPQLRQDYIFDNYVIGNNNSFAVSAGQAISQHPGERYNPFLIYGGVGLGKTHLMQAVGNSTHSSLENKKVIYITAETFINEFIHSIRSGSQTRFKNKYRNIDVLLIDDIHDLHSKKETQEELFHTFNSLYDSKKQLIFTCDRPPSELKNFTARLKSRFELGLNVDLQPPNYETRYAILSKKLEIVGVNLPEQVIELIARNVTTNIRDLESSLTKMIAYSDFVGKKITVEIAKQQLSGVFSNSSHSNITINRVQRVVSDYFNITLTDIKSKKRTKQITYPRQIAMYIIREITDCSTTEIGLEFGGRDHTTVMHSCQRIEDMMKVDPTLEPLISNLIRSIKESG